MVFMRAALRRSSSPTSVSLAMDSSVDLRRLISSVLRSAFSLSARVAVPAFTFAMRASLRRMSSSLASNVRIASASALAFSMAAMVASSLVVSARVAVPALNLRISSALRSMRLFVSMVLASSLMAVRS